MSPISRPTAILPVAPAAPTAPDAAPDDNGFAAALGRALQEVAGTGRAAETSAAAALEGSAGMTEAVVALSRAELALQAVTSLRDRALQAYQEIMRPPM